MAVTIRYRSRENEIRTLQVLPGDEAYSRALWLAEYTPQGPCVDCAVETLPADAVLGEGQDPEPYRSPRYAGTPHVLLLLEDEECRRRFVEQARRCAAYLRERRLGGAGFRRLAAVALIAGLLGCPAAPALDAREQAAAAEALAAGHALAGPDGHLAGYVLRAGEVVLWTLPAAEPGPPPEGAVARYDVATGRVKALPGRP